MQKRHYLVLIYDDARSDKMLPHGDDIGAAIEKIQTMQQEGGPDGIAGAMVVTSTGRVVKSAKLQSKSWHANQANVAQSIAADERRAAESVQRDLLDQRKQIDKALAESGYVEPAPVLPPPTPESILESFEALKAKAEELGVELPLAAPAPSDALEGAGSQDPDGNPEQTSLLPPSDAQQGAGGAQGVQDAPGGASAAATGRKSIPSPVPPRAASKGVGDAGAKV